ncbi:hypothetical protein [Streptomyces sp. NPDC101206]|uniref:hypothetical protein n=1 Tax=Streptomyces sp. NPDC101206 TaxID=3366128 RepID=UPI00382BC18F
MGVLDSAEEPYSTRQRDEPEVRVVAADRPSNAFAEASTNEPAAAHLPSQGTSAADRREEEEPPELDECLICDAPLATGTVACPNGHLV